jgi:hypothetical protein
MCPPRRHKERFFDDPHGYNLYSRADFVKRDYQRRNATEVRRRMTIEL